MIITRIQNQERIFVSNSIERNARNQAEPAYEPAAQIVYKNKVITYSVTFRKEKRIN